MASGRDGFGLWTFCCKGDFFLKSRRVLADSPNGSATGLGRDTGFAIRWVRCAPKKF